MTPSSPNGPTPFALKKFLLLQHRNPNDLRRDTRKWLLPTYDCMSDGLRSMEKEFNLDRFVGKLNVTGRGAV